MAKDTLVKLIDCMGKTTRLPDELKAAILARARAGELEGAKPISASRQAILEHLEAIQQDITNVDAVMKQPAPTKSEQVGSKLVVEKEALPAAVQEWVAADSDVEGRRKTQEDFLASVERERKTESQKLHAFANPQAVQAADAVGKFSAEVKDFVSTLPQASDFRISLLEHSGREQENSFEVLKTTKEINANARDPVGREGITNYIDAGGDRVLLAQRAHASKNLALKKGYQAAVHLTPEELGVAKKVQAAYSALIARAQHYGIPINEIKNYVTHMWEMEEGGKFWTPKKLSDYFRFSRHRTFESYFDGEQADYKPKTKDIGSLLAIYASNLNHAVNSRIFVEQLSKGKASGTKRHPEWAGQPLLAPGGSVKITADPGGPASMSVKASMAAGKGAYLVFPDSPPAAELKKIGYKSLDQPALREWLWQGNDPQGNPVLINSDLWVHPEIYRHLNNVLGRSLIREWWATETDNPFERMAQGMTKFLLDDLQSGMKATMFSLSPFHQVQEGTHAVGHRVNPFTDIPEIRLAGPNADPKQIDAVRHGLKLRADRLSQDQFIEGLGTNSKNFLTKALRKWGGKQGAWLSDLQDWYTDYLFEDYIPGLKYKTYEHILARNTDRFAKDIADGKVDIRQVKMLSANQADAAYGHLNYAAIGRSPTLQHIFQIIFLAPDFFEARARFVGQALKSASGDPRVGIEQFHALLLLAALQFAIVQIVNMLINGKVDPEEMLKHPFDIIAGNRRYGLRSVPGDLLHLGTDLYDFLIGREKGIGFVQNRLSPLVGKGVGQLLFGVNYRKEPVTLHEAVQDMGAGVIPLPFQGLTRGLTATGRATPISWWEQMMGAGGIVIHRVSPITNIYPLAREWMQENDPKKVDKTVYPVSKYQQLRFALEDNDDDRARTQFMALQDEGMTKKQIADGFRESMKMPFTGSLANDKKFYLSLSKHDRLKFDAAIDRRVTILRRFEQWLPVGHKPVTRQTLMNRIFTAKPPQWNTAQ